MPTSRLTRLLVRAPIAILAALFLGLLSAGQLTLATMGQDNRYTFSHALIMQTPLWLFWVPLLPLVVSVARWIPIERHSLRRAIPLHLLAAIGISLLHYGVQLWGMHAIGHGYESGHSYVYHFFWQLRFNFTAHLLSYLAILAGVLVRDYYRKYREREMVASQLAAQLYQAKLQALRMQLNPHFLFNAMNSIAMLVRRADNAQAVRTIAGLSDLLRYVLEESPADEVPLRDEIAFIERYLGIEQVRFQERLRVGFDVADEVLDAFVPNLILQPLVENAIRHGVARKVGPGSISVAARRLGDRLVLQVTDDGAGLQGEVRGTGVGLGNTRTRLQQLYGTQQSFELRAGAPGGAVATVSLPFHLLPLHTPEPAAEAPAA